MLPKPHPCQAYSDRRALLARIYLAISREMTSRWISLVPS
jgi:hypothetical protein